MNDIVVGVDQSPTAREAAVTAASLAAETGSNLHIVMCLSRGSSREVQVGSDRFYLDSVAEAETYLSDLSRSLPHDRITSTVGQGDPATAICEEATRLDARMIVVGNRRVKGISRVLGSVAATVAKRAPCDVLIANTA
ncbi:MAG: universal stress protein [Acidimicrobiales bacterium]